MFRGNEVFLVSFYLFLLQESANLCGDISQENFLLLKTMGRKLNQLYDFMILMSSGVYATCCWVTNRENQYYLQADGKQKPLIPRIAYNLRPRQILFAFLNGNGTRIKPRF
ncbi:hypothetical protein VNO80_17186 [Phaseolus coccineus]|uniref:Uncharacterized protein n=1 Tax=Phaseolus coccineus TaxID=3886 RepID=A0AAN9R4P3_PHACN